jgi:hypothetical protein
MKNLEMGMFYVQYYYKAKQKRKWCLISVLKILLFVVSSICITEVYNHISVISFKKENDF